MPVLFYIGGLIALRNIPLDRLDRFAPFCALILFGVTIMFALNPDLNQNYFRLISPFLWWPIAAIAMKTAWGKRCIKMVPNSFAIYLFHGPILLITWILLKKLAHPQILEYAWLFTPFLVIYIAIIVRLVLKKLAPEFGRILLGGRI